MSLVSFYTAWKYQKTSGFLIFSGGIERETNDMKWLMGLLNIKFLEFSLVFTAFPAISSYL